MRLGRYQRLARMVAANLLETALNAGTINFAAGQINNAESVITAAEIGKLIAHIREEATTGESKEASR